MGSVSMVRSDLSQSFGITSLLFSGYTISLSGRVSREQRGGAAEILSRTGVHHGNQPYLCILGGIRTYLHLVEIVRHPVDAIDF